MESEDGDEITLRIALSTKERYNATGFIESQMRKVHGCEPPETTGIILTAHMQEKIVGSIVMCGVGENTLFPVEEYYSFNSENVSLLFDRAEIVQMSRWLSVRPMVSEMLVRTSFSLAYTLGKRYALVEAKPYAIKRLVELGFSCKEICGVKLNQEKNPIHCRREWYALLYGIATSNLIYNFTEIDSLHSSPIGRVQFCAIFDLLSNVCSRTPPLGSQVVL